MYEYLEMNRYKTNQITFLITNFSVEDIEHRVHSDSRMISDKINSTKCMAQYVLISSFIFWLDYEMYTFLASYDN